MEKLLPECLLPAFCHIVRLVLVLTLDSKLLNCANRVWLQFVMKREAMDDATTKGEGWQQGIALFPTEAKQGQASHGPGTSTSVPLHIDCFRLTTLSAGSLNLWLSPALRGMVIEPLRTHFCGLMGG